MLGNATVGTALVTPVRVLVTGTDGQPLPGTKVRWEASDDGKVSSAETTTDGKGVATVRWTVGTKVGMQTLVAYITGIQPVVFGANSVADRPAVIRLSADLVRVTMIGDTVRFSSTVEDQFGNPVSTPVSVSLESGGDILLVSGS
ncbi:MAG: Ig-like domain-containing protein, partial [Gemmatimonadaceae bacterium]|nr:Ig-like domain-containing protein [Gemmatimonadaceae bacterium]